MRRIARVLFAVPILAAATGPLAVAGATAADWVPSQVKVVLPNSLGGGQDVMTRALGKVWEGSLGTKFIYEVRQGASGRIGFEAFLREPPDAPALLSSNIATTAIMYEQQDPDWNWRESVAPLGMMNIDPGVLIVNGESEFDSFADMIEVAKERKLRLSLANWASSDNMFVHQLMELTGAQFEIITAGAANDIVVQVLGGHTDVGFTKLSTVDRGGDSLRYLAVTLPENPAPLLTDNAPTVDEVVGEKTLPIASYRAILVHAEFKAKHPDRFAQLQESLEAAKDDPAFIEAAEKLGSKAELIPDWSPDEIQEILERYWSAYESYGELFAEQ